MKTPEKAPLDTVTVKGATVAIYWNPSRKNGKEYPGHSLVWTASGKRQRKFVTDLAAAKKTAREIASQLSAGTGHAHSLLPQDVADHTAATKILRVMPGTSLTSACQQFVEAAGILGTAGTLSAAARHYRDHLSAVKLPTVTVAAVAAELIAAQEASGSSRAYIGQLNKLLRRVKDAFHCPITTVQTSDMQAFVDRLDMAPRSRENYRRTFQALWNFAKRRGYLPRDRSTEADHLDTIKTREGAIGIYQPDQLQSAMSNATGAAQLMLALGSFTGLRTAELHRLEWTDIGMEHVTVQAHKAKTGARRIIPILPALAAVLQSRKRGEGRLSPFKNESHLSRMLSDCFRAVQVSPVRNGLRHSFCTYRIAATQDTAQVALEAGNSPTMLFKHYRELATKKQAAAWFSVRPANDRERVRNGSVTSTP